MSRPSAPPTATPSMILQSIQSRPVPDFLGVCSLPHVMVPVEAAYLVTVSFLQGRRSVLHHFRALRKFSCMSGYISFAWLHSHSSQLPISAKRGSNFMHLGSCNISRFQLGLPGPSCANFLTSSARSPSPPASFRQVSVLRIPAPVSQLRRICALRAQRSETLDCWRARSLFRASCVEAVTAKCF